VYLLVDLLTKPDLIQQYARWGHGGPVGLILLLARHCVCHHYEHAIQPSLKKAPRTWFDSGPEVRNH